MKVTVSLGGTINIGDFNSVRVDVSVEGDLNESYGEVFNRVQGMYFDAAYHHVKGVAGGEHNTGELVRCLMAKLKTEPRY